jgi:hypothetical protein
MTDGHNPHASRWAPWWAYLVPLLAVNYLRQLLVPPGEAGDAVSVALFVVTTGAVVLAVTAMHRLRPRGDAGRT